MIFHIEMKKGSFFRVVKLKQVLLLVSFYHLGPRHIACDQSYLYPIDLTTVPKFYSFNIWTRHSDNLHQIKDLIADSSRLANVQLLQADDENDLVQIPNLITCDSFNVIRLPIFDKATYKVLELLKQRQISSYPTIILSPTPPSLTTEDTLRYFYEAVKNEHEEYNSSITSRYLINSKVYIVTYASETGSKPDDNVDRSVQIFEIFATKYQTRVNLLHKSTSTVNVFLLLARPIRRTLRDEPLVAVAEDNPLTVTDVEFDKTGPNPVLLGGTSVHIYRDLQKMLEFREVAVPGSAIGQDKNANGITGRTYELLQDGEVDVGIQPITMNELRATWLTFLQPLSTNGGVWAFFLQPPMYSFRNILLAPFQTNLWLALLVLYLVIIVCITFLSMVKLRFSDSDEEVLGGNDSLFQQDGYLWAFAAFCQKGWHRTPTSPSLRIVFFIGCVTGVIAYAGYSANIVSVLSVKVNPVSQFNDLVNFNFEFYVHESSSILKKALEAIIDQYHLSQNPSLTATERQISRLKNSRSAFMTYRDLFYNSAHSSNESDEALCSVIYAVRVPVFLGKGAMFLKKGSDLLGIINYRLSMIRERGLSLRYWRIAAEETLPRCLENIKADLQHLGWSDVFTAWLALCIGMASALVVLAFELSVKRISGNKRRNSYKL